MRNDKSPRSYYALMHFIIFVWGFTAVLGALISLKPIALTWYRLLISVVLLAIWIIFIRKKKIILTAYDLKRIAWNGILIGLHWLLFFKAIKTGGVSVTLVAMSSGAFFTSILEPFIYGKKIKFYEILFGLLVIIVMYFTFKISHVNWLAVFFGIAAAFFGSLFSIFNARLIHRFPATVLSFYELLFAWILIGIIILFSENYNDLFKVTLQDAIWLFILGSICTAYAFTVSLEILRKISPFTLTLSINLEPVYGIILALLIFGDKEKMPAGFYIGAFFILLIVTAEGIIKLRK